MPKISKVTLLCLLLLVGFVYDSGAQGIYRSPLREQWEKLAGKNPGSSFLLAVAHTATGTKQRELRQVLLEAAEIGRTLALPVPQGFNPGIPVSAIVSEWNPKAVATPIISSGTVLGGLQLVDPPNKLKPTIQPIATVTGRLLRPLVVVKSTLVPGQPLCHIVVTGETTLTAVALACAQGNPQEFAFILRYCAELNPRIAPDLARTFAWLFPSKIQEIHQLLKKYPNVPSLESLHQNFDPFQKSAPESNQADQPKSVLMPYLYRNYGSSDYIYGGQPDS
jgi:hypothetical protein